MNLKEWKESGRHATLFGIDGDERLQHHQLGLAVQTWVEDRMETDAPYDEQVREIAREELDLPGRTLTVGAFVPETVEEDWIVDAAIDLLDHLMERFDENFCSAADEPTDIDAGDNAVMLGAVRTILASKHVYNCRRVAKIDLTGDDVVALVTGPTLTGDAPLDAALSAGIPAAVITNITLNTPPFDPCRRCGSQLRESSAGSYGGHERYCTDETCPYSDMAQRDDAGMGEVDPNHGCTCGAPQAKAPHTCPYAEINHDARLCTCCADCQQRCSDEI